ncbi:hypothetical protein B7494_g5135 [Chlorociboria aeruginascens]|nr:hypothetical protein B7494_g5135 [Chlorociboria aeruginascens]
MNNDFAPTTAADLPSPDNDNTNTDPAELRRRQEDAQAPAQKRANAQTKKKYEFITGLVNQLDVLIYIELYVLYYMDCSFFRLLLRLIIQKAHLTPSPTLLSQPTIHRSWAGVILMPNLLCLLLHIFTARPEAGEVMRGYLHGGIITDLIGQKGPTSKLHLVFLDLLVFALQTFLMVVHIERDRLAGVISAALKPNVATDEPRAAVVSSQDHDSEERGVMRDAVIGITDDQDIEMQPLTPAAAGSSSRVEERRQQLQGEQERLLEARRVLLERTQRLLEERQRLLEQRDGLLASANPNEVQEEDSNALDIFYSGTAVVAEFHILDTLRSQWNNYGSTSFSAELTAAMASGQMNATGRRLQRRLQSLSA